MSLKDRFRRKRSEPEEETTPSNPLATKRDSASEPIRITKVADYLKLVGITVEVYLKTRDEQVVLYRGRVQDLSDAGDSLVLEGACVLNHDGSVTELGQLALPLAEVDVIRVVDRLALTGRD